MKFQRPLQSFCLVAALLFTAPQAAEAFCGFYVAGSGDSLVNNATQVIMMREGKRTVLSMQNNYQGPPSDFAMVVPVPTVLKEDDVKTLPADIFAKVDKLAAPRLVEYWEQDPCAPQKNYRKDRARRGGARMASAGAKATSSKELGVTVEAQFAVGEYEIVILSAKFSSGLEAWLKQEKYAIPAGSEEYLRPYVQNGSKFFVAKVDAKKVKFVDNQAKLSPLRFHYDSESFELPVRLGLMNSQGHQDLIVHILAQGKRFELANYPNVTIPTNLNVNDSMRTRFGEFYAALFDSTLEKNPRAIVTEYSWSAASCDPCPTPPLGWGELTTLGYDVIQDLRPSPSSSSGGKTMPSRGRRIFGAPGFVLTRLHARYSKKDLGEDLIFKEAEAIVGGRERMGGAGKLEQASKPGGINNFQARYAIRHEWQGDIQCENPSRGIWGGPSTGHETPVPKAATDLAFAARGGIQLASVVPDGIPELGVQGKGVSIYDEDPNAVVPSEPVIPTPRPKTKLPANTGDNKSNKSEGCSTGGGAGWAWGLLLVGLFWRRRQR